MDNSSLNNNSVKVDNSDDLLIKTKEFIDRIDKKYPIKFAYLFGSYSRGDNNNNSDIDLAIYFKNKYSDIEDVFNRGTIIEEAKLLFSKNVDIVSLNNAPLLLKYQIIHDGIVIKDSIDRASFESLYLRMYFDFKYYSDTYDEMMINNIKKDNYF
ncbi:type VII toxin-antitoxin system MntA family adenylyltransferase antitoxin [Clostridium sp. DL1XJH146]